MKFKESALAHKYLDALAETGNGLEIGGSKHNSFGIKNCKNLDYTASLDTPYKLEEIRLCGEALPVDIVAYADDTGLPDNSVDFIINSHVFEHQPNPLKCLHEWWRITKRDGIIFSIIPNRRTLYSDAKLPLTTLGHIAMDFVRNETVETHSLEGENGPMGHYHRYTPKSFIYLIKFFNEFFGTEPKLEVIDGRIKDDKCGNGFCVVMKVCK